MKTFDELVSAIALQATEAGIDVAPSDAGFIVSLFLEGWATAMKASPPSLDHPDLPPAFYDILQQVADACSAVKDQ